MKNIIEAFLDFAKEVTDDYNIRHISYEFDRYYKEFVKHKPIGEAEQSIIDEVYQRARVGYNKYGVTTDRSDLSQAQWKQHLREELMDSLVYLTKIEDDKST